MDPKSKSEMNAYYSRLLEERGSTVGALNYQSGLQQSRRFGLLTEVEPISTRSSVLDVGCGLGHLCDYLRAHGWEGSYTGVDINPDMVAAASEGHPQDRFLCCDLLKDDLGETFDYVFCGATVQHKPGHSDGKEYLVRMITRMFELADGALAFDVFSDQVDFKSEINLYVSPVELLRMCYRLTRRVVLRNDCRPYELMVYLFKESSTDEHNIYDSWVERTPRLIRGKHK